MFFTAGIARVMPAVFFNIYILSVYFGKNPQNLLKYAHIAGSSNGRTTDSGSVYLGSSPSPAVIHSGFTAGLNLDVLHNLFFLSYDISYDKKNAACFKKNGDLQR